MTEHESRPQPMQLTRDYSHEFVGLQGIPGGVCRVRTYEGHARTPVVIATELSENENTSVTNIAEYLAAEVLTRFFRERLEEEEPVYVRSFSTRRAAVAQVIGFVRVEGQTWVRVRLMTEWHDWDTPPTQTRTPPRNGEELLVDPHHLETIRR